MEHEVWKIIEEFPQYMVSTLGRVMSMQRYITFKDGRTRFFPAKILKPTPNYAGYDIVSLYDRENKARKVQVSRLVASAFILNPNNYPQVNHRDENRKNNNVGNLEWCDAKYNCNYGTRNKRLSLQSYCKEVEQYSHDGKYIKTFPSIKMAADSVNLTRSSISRACRGLAKQIGGYKWKYKTSVYGT